jgi:DNA-binding NtrC family response regulator
MNLQHILILDDEPRLREELAEFLTDEGYKCFEAGTPSQAMDIIGKNRIDIAIVDINLPEKDGIAVLKDIKEHDEDIEVLMITGQGDMELAIRSMRLGRRRLFQ